MRLRTFPSSSNYISFICFIYQFKRSITIQNRELYQEPVILEADCLQLTAQPENGFIPYTKLYILGSLARSFTIYLHELYNFANGIRLIMLWK